MEVLVWGKSEGSRLSAPQPGGPVSRRAGTRNRNIRAYPAREDTGPPGTGDGEEIV